MAANSQLRFLKGKPLKRKGKARHRNNPGSPHSGIKVSDLLEKGGEDAKE